MIYKSQVLRVKEKLVDIACNLDNYQVEFIKSGTSSVIYCEVSYKSRSLRKAVSDLKKQEGRKRH